MDIQVLEISIPETASSGVFIQIQAISSSYTVGQRHCGPIGGSHTTFGHLKATIPWLSAV